MHDPDPNPSAAPDPMREPGPARAAGPAAAQATDRVHALERALELVRRRLERMGARPARRLLDLDDLTQETAAAVLARRAVHVRALWLSVASNKVRDRLRGVGRAPIEELGEQPLDALPARRPGPARAGDEWRGLCRRAEHLGLEARRVLAMRQGLEADWPTIAFVEARRTEAARSLFYRGREGLRPRSSDPRTRPS